MSNKYKKKLQKQQKRKIAQTKQRAKAVAQRSGGKVDTSAPGMVDRATKIHDELERMACCDDKEGILEYVRHCMVYDVRTGSFFGPSIGHVELEFLKGNERGIIISTLHRKILYAGRENYECGIDISPDLAEILRRIGMWVVTINAGHTGGSVSLEDTLYREIPEHLKGLPGIMANPMTISGMRSNWPDEVDSCDEEGFEEAMEVVRASLVTLSCLSEYM